MDILFPPSGLLILALDNFTVSGLSVVADATYYRGGNGSFPASLLKRATIFYIPWNILDRLFLGLRKERSGIIGGKSLELFEKRRVFNGLAHSPAQNVYWRLGLPASFGKSQHRATVFFRRPARTVKFRRPFELKLRRR